MNSVTSCSNELIQMSISKGKQMYNIVSRSDDNVGKSKYRLPSRFLMYQGRENQLLFEGSGIITSNIF